MARRTSVPVLGTVVALLLALSAGGAGAAGGSQAGSSQYSQDVYAVGGNLQLGSGSTMYAGSMLGLGYRLNGRFSGSKDMGWSIGAEYTKGMIKNEYSGGVNFTHEVDPSAYAIYIQVNHYYDCCDFDCGPVVYYENATITDKQTGFPDDKLKNIQMFGAGGHFGGMYPVSGKVGVFGEYSEIFGIRTYDQKNPTAEDKYTAWTFQSRYRGGLHASF